MLDTLPDLVDASEKLLSFVIPAELSEASVESAVARLQNQNTRENKKFKRLGDIFERLRKEYGGTSYINVGETLRRLLGRKAGPIDEQTAPWRPDAFLQKANLAILVSRMLSLAEQDQKDEFLEDVASTFPRPFAQRFGLPKNLTPECSALAEATFDVALEVRTQEAILLLIRHAGKSNFDFDTVLHQVFYDANVHIKGWAVAGLRTADLRKEAKDIILGRVKQLREAFGLNVPVGFDSQSYGAESLRVTFPWTTFTQRLIAWAGQRLTEIEIQTTTYGGAQAICQGIIDVVQSGRLRASLGMDDVGNESDGSEIRLVYNPPSESQATPEQQGQSRRPARADELSLPQFRLVDAFQFKKIGSPFVLKSYDSAESKKGKEAASYLKLRQAKQKATKATGQIFMPQNQGTTSDVQVASTAEPSMQALTPHRDFYEQVNHSPVLVNNSKGQAVSADQDDDWRTQEHEEEGGNFDIDRRNAQGRLAFRTQREAESNKENVAEIPEPQLTKTAEKRSIYAPDPLAVRVSPIDVGDISSDDGFQRQAEPSNAATQRRLKSATKRTASKPLSIPSRSPKKARVQEDTSAVISDGDADVAGDRQETEVPLSQAYGDYSRANELAKQKTAVGTKPPQKRSAWTGAETDMLHHLITEHGTSWKLLKEQDKAQGKTLQARDQVALKDKARNMKMDYLKYVYKSSVLFSKLTMHSERVGSCH